MQDALYFGLCRFLGIEAASRRGNRAHNIREAFEFVRDAGDEAIETLIVHDAALEGQRDLVGRSMTSEETVEWLGNHCPNVTTLNVYGNVKLWAEKFGAQVDVLAVTTKYYEGLGSVAKHCTRLRRMAVRSTGYPPRPINFPLCNKSAETLEDLKIERWPLPDTQIEKIQEKCRALKRISIIENGAALSRLLASYGNQLEWARLEGFTEDDTRVVVNACKEARFDLNERLDDETAGPRNELSPALNLPGNQLERICVNLHHPASDMSEYEAPWTRCSMCENWTYRAATEPSYRRF